MTTAGWVPSGRSLPSTPVHLQVVDGADRHAVDVEHLPVEQVQPGVEDEPGRVLVGGKAHEPAPVTIIRGIAATDAVTMITRYTSASALVTRPLTCSPMYSGSLATMRIGR